MSNEFGMTNSGNDVVKIPVELKDHSKDPVLLPESAKGERTELEKQVDAEIIAKGEKAIEDFDPTQVITVPAKKRGRKPKAVSEVVREFYCATCRERFVEKNALKIGAGDNRWAIFCPMCQKAVGFLQPDLDEKVATLIKDNPTGK